MRHLQGAFDIGWEGVLLLSVLGLMSAGLRTWVGFREPRTMFSFTLPLVIFDIALITLVVRLTGDYRSEAWLLYFALLVSKSAVMSTPALLAMLSLTGIGCVLAIAPIPTDLWTDFSYRLVALSQTTSLMHLVLRSHVDYQLELADLCESHQLLAERQRIAQKFHDGLRTTLSQVVMALEAFCLQARQDHTLTPEQIQQIQEQIAQLRAAIHETCTIIRQSEPAQGSDVRERELVRQVALRTAQLLNAQLHFDAPEAMPALTPTQSLMIICIMQEALTNTLKHAPNTCNIWVSFKHRDAQLYTCVQDDGDGFDNNRAVEGFGLHHMRERVDALGGRWLLTSQVGAHA